MAVKKRQGVKLGSPKGWDRQAQALGSRARAEKARSEDANRQAFMFIQELREGGKTWREIAGKLNKIGLKTVRGRNFHATTAMRVYNMLSKWNI